MTNRELPLAGLDSVVMGSHGGMDAAGMSNIGQARPGNEDAFLIATLQRSLVVHDAHPTPAQRADTRSFEGTLLIVADGMGGEGGGDVASRIAVSTITSYLLNVMPWDVASFVAPPGEPVPPSIGQQLSSALLHADTQVKQAAAQSTTPRMGTTLTLALVVWPALYVAHVGDTRLYLLRAGQLSRLTTDHTVAQRMMDEAPDAVPPASDLHHVLWNSLGGTQSLPQPQIVTLELVHGDRLLLCSDGLTKHVADTQILAVLAASASNAYVCEQLVALANGAGGSDNVTVLVADARALPGPARKTNGNSVRPDALAQTLNLNPAPRGA